MILALGCSNPSSDSADALAIPDVDVPQPTAAWTAEDVADAWNAAMALGWPDAAHAMAVYTELLSHGDAECPGSTEQLDDSLVIGCTAESGYWYSGVATYSTGEKAGGAYERLHGDFWLATDAGVSYRVGGTTYRYTKGGLVTDYFEGTWIWEGDDGPFAGGVSGAAATTIGDSVTVDGALGFGGLAFSAALEVGDVPTGELAIRDPEFGWHTATFDGDPCVTVTHDSGSSGDACFDFSALQALREAR